LPRSQLASAGTEDQLLGAVAAEANHASSRRLQDKLDAVCDRIDKTMRAYDERPVQRLAAALTGGDRAGDQANEDRHGADR
jgi:hypothetical protein